MKLYWPWNHVEAEEHAATVKQREALVEQIYREARKQKIENGLGIAVKIALAGLRKGHAR